MNSAILPASERPIEVIDKADMKAWFDKNPNGTVIMRHKASDTVAGLRDRALDGLPSRPAVSLSSASGAPRVSTHDACSGAGMYTNPPAKLLVLQIK